MDKYGGKRGGRPGGGREKKKEKNPGIKCIDFWV